MAAEGTVTEAGTVSSELLLASVMVVPPTGADWVIVVVHVDVPFSVRLEGLQVTDDRVVIVITPPDAASDGSPVPLPATPIGFVTAIDVLVAFDARVTWKLATVPAPMPVVFRPVARHVSAPEADAQTMDFPATVAAAPALAVMAVIWFAG